MRIANTKVLDVVGSNTVYGLVKNELFRRRIHFVDKRICAPLFNVVIMVREGKKETSVDGEVFNMATPFGRQILILFKVAQIDATTLIKMQTHTRKVVTQPTIISKKVKEVV